MDMKEKLFDSDVYGKLDGEKFRVVQRVAAARPSGAF